MSACASASATMNQGERIYRVRRTVLQMLRDRGYMVDQTDIDESEEAFFEKHTTSPQRDALTLRESSLWFSYSISSNSVRGIFGGTMIFETRRVTLLRPELRPV